MTQHHDAPPGDDARLVELARRSHAIIAANQHTGGAYPASPTFSAYRGFAWLRDGAFTAEGMSRYGDVASADAFHDWAAGVLVARSGQVADLVGRAAAGDAPTHKEMLPTRFTLDGANGSDPWWDFQTDGYGAWLWSVVTHAERHGLDLERWREGIEVGVDYVCAFWSSPCYDWWEEHVEQRHLSTLGALHGGLVAVARSGVLSLQRAAAARDAAERIRALALDEGVSDGRDRPEHLVKWIGSTAVDASLASCIIPFELVAPIGALARGTLDAIRSDLDAGGGVHRFPGDVFYGGGEWLLLSCLLGWNEAATGDRTSALARLRWVADHALPSGEMPEQVDDHLLHAGSRAEWVERWGPVATPLLWSHGMYLILADELGLLPDPESR